MVGSTVGSRWQVLYGTVLKQVARVVSAAAADESYWCGELSNASTVPYRTVAVSRYCRTVLVTRTLVSHSFRDKD